ncbi:MAG: GNAT family N-acetyltransferase [Thermoplasmata archaeon]
MTDRARDALEVVVREVSPVEWSAYREVRLRALETDPLAFGSTRAREQAFSSERWKERISRGQNTSAGRTWVAVDLDGRFVGTAAFAADLEGTLRLFAMWVEPGSRGQGVGGRILDAALTWLHRVHPGLPVLLDVNPRQVAAVRLYESRGFQRTGATSSLDHTPGEVVVEMAVTPGADQA